jgi:putative peptidoglycan lipid II flippase
VWALGYAGGYQAGLIVVLILANRVEGGVAAYQWAYTFFYLPHALFGVPIFNVLFTAMSEHAARDEVDGAVGRLRDGLSMLAFLLIPIAAMLFATAELVSRVTLRYGVMTTEGSDLVGHVLQAFAIGLPSYSAFLVFTRAFYAIGDTRTPAVVNAGTVLMASAAGALFFSLAPDGWEVPGLAFGHSVGFFIGAAVMAKTFGSRAGTVGGTRVSSSVVRSLALGIAAGAAMFLSARIFDATSNASALIALAVVALVGAVVYLGGMVALKAPEIGRLRGLVASR